MSYAFDSLGYARSLEDAGVERRQAEAHATAARTFILAEVATKADVDNLRAEIKHEALKGVVMTCGYITALVAAVGVITKMLIG